METNVLLISDQMSAKHIIVDFLDLFCF